MAFIFTDSIDDNQLFLEDEKEESVLEQTGYAKNKLNQLQERLNNKSQALQVNFMSRSQSGNKKFSSQKFTEIFPRTVN